MNQRRPNVVGYTGGERKKFAMIAAQDSTPRTKPPRATLARSMPVETIDGVECAVSREADAMQRLRKTIDETLASLQSDPGLPPEVFYG
jgi:hypothetical protein